MKPNFDADSHVCYRCTCYWVCNISNVLNFRPNARTVEVSYCVNFHPNEDLEEGKHAEGRPALCGVCGKPVEHGYYDKNGSLYAEEGFAIASSKNIAYHFEHRLGFGSKDIG